MAELQREYVNNTDSIDFTDGLGEGWGADDTTVIAKNQLDSFMFNEQPVTSTDVDNIQKVEAQQDTTKQQSQQQDKQPTQQATPTETSEEKAEKASNILKDFLFDSTDKDKDKDKDKNQDDTSNTSTDDKGNDDTQKDENQFVTLSRDLYKLGVFTTEDDKDPEPVNTPEEFLERFNQEKKKGASEILENFLEQFGDDYKRMFTSVFVKGVDPRDYLASYSKIESMKGIDLSDAANQEKVFVNYYRSQGLSEERIQKRLEKSKDYGDLEEEAKDLHDLMIQREEKDLVQKEQDRQAELQAKQTREIAYQENVGKIIHSKLSAGDFDGIPVTKKEAQEVFNYMTHKPYKLPNGELITEMQKDWLELDKPQNHELKVKVGLLLKNKMDLSKVKKRAVSSQNDTLFSNLTHKQTTQTRKEGTVTATKSFFD